VNLGNIFAALGAGMSWFFASETGWPQTAIAGSQGAVFHVRPLKSPRKLSAVTTTRTAARPRATSRRATGGQQVRRSERRRYALLRAVALFWAVALD
jgi:hypothetical protein